MVSRSETSISSRQSPPIALVTGATGMLGRHTVAYLREQGVEVRALVRPKSDVGHLQEAGVILTLGEATDEAAIRRATQGVDLLFHLAGYLTVSSPFGAADESPLYQTVNVEFTERLLAAARENNVSRFIFTSSNSVYAPDAPVPTAEDAPLRPQSAYGRSKLAAEERVRAYQDLGLPTTIVRPSVIYGPDDRYFTPAALRLARLPLLPLVNGGQTLFDMVYACDVVRLLWRAATVERAAGRVYNAGPGRPTTLAQLVDAYRRLEGRGPRILNLSEQAARRFAGLGRPLLSRLAPGAEAALTPRGVTLMARDIHLDMRRAEEELGYRPRYSLEEGLRQTLRAFQP